MFASGLISHHILPLKTTDSLQAAADRMNDFKLNHLPVVQEREYLGLLSESNLVEYPDFTKTLAELPLHLDFSYVYEHQHAFEVYKLMTRQSISLVPVLTSLKEYVGAVTLERMVVYGAEALAAAGPGGLIVIESTENNYSLSEITHILETNGCRILSCQVSFSADSRKVEITLKVNKIDIHAELSALSRFNYLVSYSYQESGFMDESQERFESFMNYLNM